jgi:tetratricopeptide (TPR) repeat protein
MKYRVFLLSVALAGMFLASILINIDCKKGTKDKNQETQAVLKGELYAGSGSCRECHEKFYRLWATSHHGLAMQPYTMEFAKKQLTLQTTGININNHSYCYKVKDDSGWIREIRPEGERNHRITYALGGKNVFYFLTPMEKGRSQILPVAYDVRRQEWFDTTQSSVRHFTDMSDEPLHWTDIAYTFNTSCHGCHVSQVEKNYDLKTDTYHTTWIEPGINCETCHGPGAEHIRLCKETAESKVPEDLKLVVVTQKNGYTAHQTDTACVPCHAKMIPLTEAFQPGEDYFDYYDLITLEHRDFYPDGRDLGENYTYTLWMMSPCTKSGELDCLYCHTSSGRFRHKDAPNNSCLPCHEERVKNVGDHSHHENSSEGSKCISCHMPQTEFARMLRSDHSMLPPTPATSIAYSSQNACNICHDDQDAAWAERWVRKWHKGDYQKPVLHRAGLLDSARKNDWTRLPEILAYLQRPDRNDVYANSLIRLLSACQSEEKWPVLIKSLRDPSPLVRSSAASVLVGNYVQEAVDALFEATRDEYRLVRIRAAATLAGFPLMNLSPQERKDLEAAFNEFERSMKSRPDNFSSHYNLGNFYMERGETKKAIASYEFALKFRPEGVVALVNASIAYARIGNSIRADKFLRRALTIDSENAAANFNMGLLMAETNKPQAAKKYLHAALKTDPNMAEAAYNLGVLYAHENIDEAIRWSQKAAEQRSHLPKYAYTYAFYLNLNGQVESAVKVLKGIIEHHSFQMDAYLLLGDIYERQKNFKEAEAVYLRALDKESINPQIRRTFEARLYALQR